MSSLIVYQHDSAARFRFVLRGELTGDRVREFEHAWNTSRSILAGKELVVDVSGVTGADPAGIGLLERMRESGALLRAALRPESSAFLRALGIRAVAPPGNAGEHSGHRNFLRLVGICG